MCTECDRAEWNVLLFNLRSDRFRLMMIGVHKNCWLLVWCFICRAFEQLWHICFSARFGSVAKECEPTTGCSYIKINAHLFDIHLWSWIMFVWKTTDECVNKSRVSLKCFECCKLGMIVCRVMIYPCIRFLAYRRWVILLMKRKTQTNRQRTQNECQKGTQMLLPFAC